MLGMLGSAYGGERASAALLISRMLREKGCTWDQIVVPAATEEASDDWRAQAAEAGQYPGLLSQWERGFIRGLAKYKEISPKQRATLDQIVLKVRA